MRLKGIKYMDEANRFIQEEFIPHAHNPKPTFVKLHAGVDLESIFCVKEYAGRHCCESQFCKN